MLCAVELAALADEAPPEGAETQFSPDRLDQIVAPIALYPDSLLMQMMMASTYPTEIVQADRWRRKNAGLTGDDLQTALASQTWDDSVKSLTSFPDQLHYMSENLDWTQDLGDAFLGQQSAVLDAVQRMRQRAYESGNLKTSDQQKVVVQGGDTQPIIQIEPAQPEVVYVPAYNPTVVYGSAWAPPSYYYPAVMAPPPWYVATAGLVSFGVGLAVGASLWGGCNWGTHNVYVNNNVNINRNFNQTNVNRSNINRQTWQHDPAHRGGVAYRNPSVERRYEGGQRAEARQQVDRGTARGFDRSPNPQGEFSRSAANRPAEGVNRGGQPSSERPGGGSGGSRGGLFGGEGGNSGRQVQAASARGAESRGGRSFAGSPGGGGGFQRGGGGGGFHGGGGRGGGGRRR